MTSMKRCTLISKVNFGIFCKNAEVCTHNENMVKGKVMKYEKKNWNKRHAH